MKQTGRWDLESLWTYLLEDSEPVRSRFSVMVGKAAGRHEGEMWRRDSLHEVTPPAT